MWPLPLGNRIMAVGGCGTMHEPMLSKEWRALVHMQLIVFHKAIFACPCVLLDCPPVLWWLSPGEVWDAVGIICTKDTTIEIKAQVSSI